MSLRKLKLNWAGARKQLSAAVSTENHTDTHSCFMWTKQTSNSLVSGTTWWLPQVLHQNTVHYFFWQLRRTFPGFFIKAGIVDQSTVVQSILNGFCCFLKFCSCYQPLLIQVSGVLELSDDRVKILWTIVGRAVAHEPQDQYFDSRFLLAKCSSLLGV